jgi:Flp pilus assembly protein TadD
MKSLHRTPSAQGLYSAGMERIPRIGSRTRWALFGAACLAAVFLCFGHALRQDFSPVDDSYLIYNNLAVRGPTPAHLRTVFSTYDPELYIPLTLVSFQIDYLLGGMHPWIFHLTNLLLHAANAFLVGTLLWLLLRRRTAAFMGGLLFAVHPLNTEAVVWAAGRKDLLCVFFVLLTLIAWLRYREAKRGMYALALLFFLLALLSKALAITLPVLLLLHALLLEGRRIERKLILQLIPFIALSGVFVGIAAFGKTRVVGSSSAWGTLLMAGKSAIFYLQHLVWPAGLTVYYQFRGAITLADPQFFVPALLVIGLLALAVWVWKRAGWISFGILWYLVTLLPTFLNFHKGESEFYAVDRYAYLPMIGVLFLLAIILAEWLERRPTWPRALGGAALVTLFCVLSIRQTRTWDSAETLFGHALAVDPASVVARTDVARVQREEGKLQEAFDTLKGGLAYGDDPALRMAVAYVYARSGDVQSAREQLEKASEMAPANPEPWNALGGLALQAGDTATALTDFRKAVALDESYVDARVSLGTLLMQSGDWAGAGEQFRKAVLWNRNSAPAHAGLAQELMHAGDEAGAAAEARAALEADPQNAATQKILGTGR